MNAIQHTQINTIRVMWLAVALALIGIALTIILLSNLSEALTLQVAHA